MACSIEGNAASALGLRRGECYYVVVTARFTAPPP